MMDLREKIARIIDPRPWTGGREALSGYKAGRDITLSDADEILAIPEIAEALEFHAKLPRFHT